MPSGWSTAGQKQICMQLRPQAGASQTCVHPKPVSSHVPPDQSSSAYTGSQILGHTTNAIALPLARRSWSFQIHVFWCCSIESNLCHFFWNMGSSKADKLSRLAAQSQPDAMLERNSSSPKNQQADQSFGCQSERNIEIRAKCLCIVIHRQPAANFQPSSHTATQMESVIGASERSTRPAQQPYPSSPTSQASNQVRSCS